MGPDMRTHRRAFLQLAGSSFLGLNAGRALEAPAPKSVILVLLTGGASQLDSFDPKPDAPADPPPLLLDVLEHTEDTDVLAEARRVVRPRGRVLTAVPAHQWLWSDRDLVAGHRRRYSRAGLRLSPDAEQLLSRHSWPGNVRELRDRKSVV